MLKSPAITFFVYFLEKILAITPKKVHREKTTKQSYPKPPREYVINKDTVYLRLQSHTRCSFVIRSMDELRTPETSSSRLIQQDSNNIFSFHLIKNADIISYNLECCTRLATPDVA